MRALIVSIAFVLTASLAFSSTIFDKFFTSKTMRVDYFHTGTKGEETFSLEEVLEEDEWPGSKVNLIDTLNLGEYMVRVFDVQTNAMIFSRGYSTMFNEWQTTDEALAGIHKTFSESVRLPSPKRKIQFTIARRDKRMQFHELWSIYIDPAAPDQVQKSRVSYDFKVNRLMGKGSPQERVDIVIIGDGYSKNDVEKFRKDAAKFNEALFKTEPFKRSKDDFNVWAIEALSQESGIDIPDRDVWRKNILGSRYSTFGSARYVLTTDNKTLREIASLAPYDFICILINDTRYGGGGIYNLYATTYTNEEVKGQEWQMEYVYVHEFGHSFGGLGDEYYGSSVAYNDFYLPGVEPWEPNVTAETHKDKLKWRGFVEAGTEIPTAWNKPAYDSLEVERGKLDRLAADYYQKREPIFSAQKETLADSKLENKVGSFEGAGYAAKGLYRPSVDCRMFSLSLNDFDPVCSAAIVRVIQFYAR